MKKIRPLTLTKHPKKAYRDIWRASIFYVNEKIELINELIDEINQDAPPLSPEEKIKNLHKIRAIVQQMEMELSCDVFSGVNQEYIERIRKQLFISLQTELASLGVYLFDAPCDDEENTISFIIANMSPDKAEILAQKLGEKDLESLATLYSEGDESNEARRFREFRARYTIRRLGGCHNQIYKVTNVITQQSQVLILEEVLGESTSAAAQVRHHTQHVTRRFVERGVGSRFLVVTEYCTESLTVKIMTGLSASERQYEAAYIYRQMAAIFTEIDAASAFFPDAKNANWLFLEDKLRIADSKSFKHSENGRHYRSRNPLLDSKITSTFGSQPPELFDEGISVDKAHAFMLGRNLLEFLTRANEGVRESLITPSQLSDFLEKKAYEDIFRGVIGGEYKALLMALLPTCPDDRLSMAEAYDRLQFIEHLTHVRCFGFDTHDYILRLRESFHKRDHLGLYQAHCMLESTIGTLGTFSHNADTKAFIAELRQEFASKGANTEDIIKRCQERVFETLMLTSSMAMGEAQALQAQKRRQFVACDNADEREEIIQSCIKFIEYVRYIQTNGLDTDDYIHRLRESFYEFNHHGLYQAHCLLEEMIAKLEALSQEADTKALVVELRQAIAKPDANTEEILQRCQLYLNEFATKIDEDHQFERIVSAIRKFAFGEADEKMRAYIRKMRQDYKAAPDKSRFLDECEGKLIDMQGDRVLSGIHDTLGRHCFKGESSRSHRAKAKKIVEAMQAIEVEDRGKIFQPESTPAFRSAKTALASRRQWLGGLKEAKVDSKGDVIDSKAIRAFIELKKRAMSVADRAKEASKEEASVLSLSSIIS